MVNGLFADLADPVQIEWGVRLQLAASLDHIRSVLGPHSATADTALGKAVAQVRAQRQPCGVMARYFDLISAVQKQDIPEAERLSEAIRDLGQAPPEFATSRYDEDTLGEDFERLPRLVFAETQGRIITSPAIDSFRAAQGHVAEALDVLAVVDPRIAREFHALCSQIVLASGRKGDGRPSFGGVTSLLAWGTIFLNIDVHADLEAMVLGIAHETTHATLLGLSAVEPLVNNPPGEDYASPLRPDARPMDGLYHATIVCGRLAYLNSLWSKSDAATQADRDRRRSTAAESRKRFLDGKRTVDEAGQLSPLAREIIDECDAAISEIA